MHTRFQNEGGEFAVVAVLHQLDSTLRTSMNDMSRFADLHCVTHRKALLAMEPSHPGVDCLQQVGVHNYPQGHDWPGPDVQDSSVLC